MEDIFTNIYENNNWGNNKNDHYSGSSGPGSSVELNIKTYIPFLKKFIHNRKIKTVVDLGCGDFRCGPYIYNNLNINYIGYDIYQKIIEYNAKEYSLPKYHFIHLDFFTNKELIKGGDVCILKDVLQHWSLENINIFLDYLVENKIFKYILICNCGYQNTDNTDIDDGDWRALSCDFYPLKKYNPKKLYKYSSKEISVIEVI